MGLKEANQNFSRLVRAIRAGRTVMLTDRGKPLATISPVAQARRKNVNDREALIEAAIDRLVAEGHVTQRGSGRPMDHRNWKPVKLRGGPSIVETLLEDREDRV